jgi:hypothetical protein
MVRMDRVAPAGDSRPSLAAMRVDDGAKH